MLDKVTCLKQANLFQGLTEQELTPIAAVSRPQTYSAGTRLFNAGETATHFFLLLSGVIRLYRINPQGKEKIIELIQAGETFAEAVVFLNKPYPVYAEALEDSTLLAIPSTVLLTEIRQQPDFALKLLANLSIRLHRFLNDIHTLSLESAQQRIINFLLAEGGEKFAHWHSKAVIASRLGLTPETFSRILSHLKEQQVIREVAGNIQVLDRKRLCLLGMEKS